MLLQLKDLHLISVIITIILCGHYTMKGNLPHKPFPSVARKHSATMVALLLEILFWFYWLKPIICRVYLDLCMVLHICTMNIETLEKVIGGRTLCVIPPNPSS